MTSNEDIFKKFSRMLKFFDEDVDEYEIHRLQDLLEAFELFIKALHFGYSGKKEHNYRIEQEFVMEENVKKIGLKLGRFLDYMEGMNYTVFND